MSQPPDPAACGQIAVAWLERSRPLLIGYLRRILPFTLRDQAEDAYQDVALVVFRKASGTNFFDPSLHSHTAGVPEGPPPLFRGWVYRITHNVALSRGRARGRARGRGGADGDGPLNDVADDRRSPSSALNARERIARVLGLMQTALDPTDADILHRHYIDGRSYKDIADELNMTHAAVRTRAMRALEQLLQLLESPPFSNC